MTTPTQPKRLIDFFASFYEYNRSPISGIINTHSPPWSHEDENGQMDILYKYNWSGEKIISPFVSYWESSNEPEEKVKAFVEDAIWSTFNRKWLREWELVQEAYDALENIYRVTDEYNDKYRQEDNTTDSVLQKKRDGNIIETSDNDVNTTNRSSTQDNTTQRSLSERQVNDITKQTDVENAHSYNELKQDNTNNYGESTGIYGFNSTTSQPSTTKDSLSIDNNLNTEQKYTDDNKESQNVKNTHDNNNLTFTGDSSNEEYNQRNENSERIAKQIENTENLNKQFDRRYGTMRDNTSRNMAAHGRDVSPQSLAEEELKFRSWNFWYNMFHDIDSILTLSIY